MKKAFFGVGRYFVSVDTNSLDIILFSFHLVVAFKFKFAKALEAPKLGTLVFPLPFGNLLISFLCVFFQCFHKAPMHMTHEAAMEYCETKPGHFPLLLKTKEEIMEMASKFPGTGDIWWDEVNFLCHTCQCSSWNNGNFQSAKKN